MCPWGESLKPQSFAPLSGDFFCPKLCRKEKSKYRVASALEGDWIPGDNKAPGNMPVRSGGGEPYGKCLESWSLLPHVVALVCECPRLPWAVPPPGITARGILCFPVNPSRGCCSSQPACLQSFSVFLCCVSLSSGIDCFFQRDLLFLI